MFIAYFYRNIKSKIGTTAGRWHFGITGQDGMWVLAVKAVGAARGSEGKG